MTVLQVLKKAYDVKVALDALALAKVNTLRSFQGLPPLMPWYDLCYMNTMDAIRQVCCKAFCPCVMYRNKTPKTRSRRWYKRLCIDGTHENTVVKHFFGYVAGVAISLFMYVVMVYQLDYGIQRAAIYCVIAGLGLTLGLAFSLNFRCITLLIVPNMASSKGRTFILMYTLVLAMNYPVKNFHHNIMVMSESATCGQSMAYNQTKELVDAALSPMVGIMNTLRTVLDALKTFAATLRQVFLTLKRAIEEIAAAIKRAGVWLVGMVTKCNEKMGGPYRKCKNAFDNAYEDCKRKLGFMWFTCGIVKVVGFICHVARIGELLCLLTDFLKGLAKRIIGRPVSRAIGKVYDMFYVKIKFHYHYNVTMQQSKSYSQVKDDILNEIKARLKSLDTFLAVLNHVMMISVVFVLLRTLLYRHKYLTNDKFDNHYITNQLRAVDERREQLRQETVFPLSWKERGKYKTTCSRGLTFKECKKLVRGVAMWVGATLHVTFYMMCDYGLYWILSLIRTHFAIKVNAGVPATLQLHVEGEGVLADMYRSMVSMFDPLAKADLKIDTTKCLPNPSVPNFLVYKKIGSLVLLCLLLVIFESLGMRLRHVIAACYYPEREKARAVWLYNHILKKRGGFLKFLRRQIRRKYLKDTKVKKISIVGGIVARFPCIGKVFKAFGYNRKACLSCGREGQPGDMDNFQHCENAGCKAVYCMDCFDDLNNMCTTCMNPVEYGDNSDFSEERDSSDDESEMERKREKARIRQQKMEERRRERSGVNQLATFKTMFGGTDSKIAQTKTGNDPMYLETVDSASYYTDEYYNSNTDVFENSGSVDTLDDLPLDKLSIGSFSSFVMRPSDDIVDVESLLSQEILEEYDYDANVVPHEPTSDQNLDYSYQYSKIFDQANEERDYTLHNRTPAPPIMYYSPLEQHAVSKTRGKSLDLVSEDFLSDTDTSEDESDSNLNHNHYRPHGLMGVVSGVPYQRMYRS